MAKSELETYVSSWRKAEDRFYQSVLNAPELYTDGIRLVRSLTDHLAEIQEVEALPAAYVQFDTERIAAIAESLELILRDFINYELARDAAFYLRYQEILEAKAQAEIQARIAEAHAQGAEWVVLYNHETPGPGRPPFQRLEMHLPDGLALYTAIELDWEKGRVYVVEPLVLDPTTGLPQRGVAPPDPKQEFTTRAEMMALAVALREKYSAEQAS